MSDDAVRGVLSGTPILLLGFDGPICSVFSGYPARTVADEVPRFVVGQGAPLPAAAMATDDPLEVLAATEQTGDLILTRETAAFLRERETIAAATAELTPGITEVLAEAMRTDRMIVVVSENADSAVHTVLERHGLTAAVDGVIGRHDWMFPTNSHPTRSSFSWPSWGRATRLPSWSGIRWPPYRPPMPLVFWRSATRTRPATEQLSQQPARTPSSTR